MIFTSIYDELNTMNSGEQKTYVDAPEVMSGISLFLENLENDGNIRVLETLKQGFFVSVTIEKL